MLVFQRESGQRHFAALINLELVDLHAIKDHIIAINIMGGYVVGLCLGTVLAPICICVMKTKMDADEPNNSDHPLDNQQLTRRQEEPNDDYAVSNRNNISVPRPT